MTIADAVAEYLDYLGEQNKSQATSATYKYALQRFLKFLAQEDKLAGSEPLERLTQDQARRFGLHLYRLKLSAASRSTYLVVLRSWFRHLSKRPDLPAGSPVNPELIELPKHLRPVPSPDERNSLRRPSHFTSRSVTGVTHRVVMHTARYVYSRGLT